MIMRTPTWATVALLLALLVALGAPVAGQVVSEPRSVSSVTYLGVWNQEHHGDQQNVYTPTGTNPSIIASRISYHYDLGNDFYSSWLDDTMTYSSAKFETGQEDLEKAQIQKYASMVDQMGAKAGDHVLEIGCGWGGFAEYAAKERGLKVTGLTISREQYDYAVKRIEAAGHL